MYCVWRSKCLARISSREYDKLPCHFALDELFADGFSRVMLTIVRDAVVIEAVCERQAMSESESHVPGDPIGHASG